MRARPSSALTRTALTAVRRGHPWVYREGLVRPPLDLATGSTLALTDERGAVVAHGLWDAASPLAVRIVALAPPGGRAEDVDEGLLARRLEAAAASRDRLFEPAGDTDAYRMCNGEGDRVPGLVVDRYATVGVVRLDGDAIATWLDRLVEPLRRTLTRRGVTTVALRERGQGGALSDRGRPAEARLDRAGSADRRLDPGRRRQAPGDRRREGTSRLTTLAGPDAPERIVVREHGVSMEVDLWHGQKTGAFLDQRDNRARVRRLAAGRERALNLFSYAGGFSVTAALGGAAHVTSVDIASGAHASAQRTFRLNGLDPGAHSFVTGDAFDFLERARTRGDRFDLVVSDPPSFAPNERAKPKALAAYRRLHAAAAAVLAPGGCLCAASCSSHVTAEDFAATLDAAAIGRTDLRLLELHGQPADHPTLPAWSEGRYLKLAVLA